jgi:hypothetical protein
MKTLATIVLLIICWAGQGFAQETDSPPALSLVKAAQIADERIAEAKLPPNNFLRSIRLIDTSKDIYYLAQFAPPIAKNQVPDAGGEPVVRSIQVLRINMDGSSSFVSFTQTISHAK